MKKKEPKTINHKKTAIPEKDSLLLK